MSTETDEPRKSLGLVNPLDVIVQARLCLTAKAFDALMARTNGIPTVTDVLEAIEQERDCD